MNTGEIKIYKAKNGLAEIQVRLENESVWLSQSDMQILFGRDQSVISRHINNVFKKRIKKRKQYAFFAYCKFG